MTNSFKNTVYALFDDGTADQIIFKYFGAPLSQDIPIRAFSNDIHDIDVDHSVIDGASAALVNYEQYYKSGGERYCFAYKFASDKSNKNITGKSAGLAFCLKFALKLFKNRSEGKKEFSIAATGIIEINEDDAVVKAVSSINNKLQAALNQLSPGDIIFYPDQNNPEVDHDVKNKIQQKGIRLVPVDNVNQTIGILLKDSLIDTSAKTGPKGKQIAKWFLIVSLITILCLALYLVLPVQQTISCYNQVVNKLEIGDYNDAVALCKLCSGKVDNDSIDFLQTEIKRELNLSVNFTYIKKNNENLIDNENSPLLLGMDDGYRFEVESPENCFLYIFQFDSEIETEMLFPLSAFVLNQNYIRHDNLIKIPGGENMFYLTDHNHHGQITIFIVAAKWRLKDLENIYNNYEGIEKRAYKRKLRDELINRFEHYSVLRKSQINSIFLKKLSFIQK